MRARRLGAPLPAVRARLSTALAAFPVALGLAGCGGEGAPRAPAASALPLVGGARVVSEVKACDGGASPFCALQIVVADPRFPSSDDLVRGERSRLGRSGWTFATGDVSLERAADSPGHKLRLTYATAQIDLEAVDLGWIKRAGPVTLALSRAMFSGTPTMSMMLELGSQS